MPENPRPDDLSAGDLKALRVFAVLWGAVFCAGWLLIEDNLIRAKLAAVNFGTILVTLGGIYLLRRLRQKG